MCRSLCLVMFLVSCASTAQPSHAPRAFNADDIRAAEQAVTRALESSDPTAWVYLYTEDAVLVESGERIEGRPALLAMARAMKPLRSVVIEPYHTEGAGHLAYVLSRSSWVGANGTTKVRALMVWRRDADGVWRIAHESLTPDN